jgi:hypothetical protein
MKNTRNWGGDVSGFHRLHLNLECTGLYSTLYCRAAASYGTDMAPVYEACHLSTFSSALSQCLSSVDLILTRLPYVSVLHCSELHRMKHSLPTIRWVEEGRYIYSEKVNAERRYSLSLNIYIERGVVTWLMFRQ